MTTLDQVIQMQHQGYSTNQIITSLQQQGITPREINDALNQAQIKSAVSQSPQEFQQSPSLSQEMQPTQPQGIQYSQPMQQEPQQNYAPQAPQEMQQQEFYPQQEQGYPEQAYYPQQEQSYSTDTISEIAEQVVSDKFKDFTKKTGDLVYFKEDTQEKLKKLDARLTKIEDTIGKLQQAIIAKVGEFGNSSSLIQRDLENLHGTMQKLVNPLVDNYNEMKKLNKKK